MSESSPADLAVAFRSFPRRLREALATAEDDPERLAAAEPLIQRLEQVVGEAAAVVGATGRDIASLCTDIADRISAVPSDHWDEATLDRLRDSATKAGQLLRDIALATAG